MAFMQAGAQFRGGIDDGINFFSATGRPLGPNHFIGGNDDGINTALSSSQPLGQNLFTGGNDDGVTVFLSASQPLGQNIFTGGNDDGINTFLSASQPLGQNIFTGGNDDGINTFLAASQPLGQNVYRGGADDGWAVAFTANLALPVVLEDFSGRWDKSDALLQWRTSQEVNTARFELERSFTGSGFAKIAEVTAAGQSSVPRNYGYTDTDIKSSLPAGIVYYRLRTVDADGQYSYSGVVVLRYDKGTETQYAVYPNPAKDMMVVAVTGTLPAHGMLLLADAQGRVMLRQQLTDIRQKLNVSQLPTGIYFLQLADGTTNLYTQKIIIQK